MEVAYKPRGLCAPPTGLVAGAVPTAELPFVTDAAAGAGTSAASTATGGAATAAPAL